MNCLYLYTWFTKKIDFLKPLQDNEAFYNKGIAVWNSLEVSSIVFVIILFGVSIIVASMYYLPFNNKPGRHYKIQYWITFLCGSIFLTAIVTYLFAYVVIKNIDIEGSLLLIAQISAVNALYSAVLYLITSFIYCNWSNTNANRFLKI